MRIFLIVLFVLACGGPAAGQQVEPDEAAYRADALSIETLVDDQYA